MRDVTTEELNEYFLFARDGPPNSPGFTTEQGQLIVNAISKTDLLEAIADATYEDAKSNPDPQALAYSLWVMGFQMGREFETRARDLNALAGLG